MMEKATPYTCACWRMRERDRATESAREGCTLHALYNDFPSLFRLPQPAVERPDEPERINTAMVPVFGSAGLLRLGAPW